MTERHLGSVIESIQVASLDATQKFACYTWNPLTQTMLDGESKSRLVGPEYLSWDATRCLTSFE